MPTFVIKICTLSLIVCTSLEPQNRNEGKDGLDNWKSKGEKFLLCTIQNIQTRVWHCLLMAR